MQQKAGRSGARSKEPETAMHGDQSLRLSSFPLSHRSEGLPENGESENVDLKGGRGRGRGREESPALTNS